MKTVTLALIGGLAFAFPVFAQESCTFDDWAWHSAQGKAVDYQTVRMRRDQLRDTQRHPTLPCSVCREDQADVTLSNGKRVTVCKAIAPKIEAGLERALASGFSIKTLTGYRVGRTRGPLDARGLRTEYSNHSYGLAIDLNAEANGLYGRCIEWGPRCQLRRGGVWDPHNPLSITRESPAYDAMRLQGFQWGGELSGRQKDFMHFSLTGD